MQTRLVILGCGFFLFTLMAFSIGAQFLVGFIVAVIITLSSILTLRRLPRFIRTFMLRFPLLTNLAATTLAGLLLNPASVTGLVAMAVTWLLVDLVQLGTKYAVLLRAP